MGAKKKPFYRIIVTEKRSKRDGRFLEALGYYDPRGNPLVVKMNDERINYWIERGAQPTETVRSLIKRKKSGEAADKTVETL
jgi:small subunit ribosomal protein S16